MKRLFLILSFFLISGCTAIFWNNIWKNPRDNLQAAEAAYKSSNFDDAYELYDLVSTQCYDTTNNYQIESYHQNDCTEEPLYILTKENIALLQSTSSGFTKIGETNRYIRQLQSLNANQKTLKAMNEYLKIANKAISKTEDERLKNSIQNAIRVIKERQKIQNKKTQTNETPALGMMEQVAQEQEKKLKELNQLGDSLDKENEALKSKKMF